MATFTPIITGTPGYPPSYNVGMAETFSWIPIENDANRPLFARAGYITNLDQIKISLSASELNVNNSTVETLIGATNTLLKSLTSSGEKLVGFSIPPYDEIVLSYAGSTNNLDTVIYKNGGTAALTLRFTYTAGTSANNNALLASVKKL